MRSGLTIQPIVRAHGVVTLPGSKSISIRALLVAALAEGVTTLSGVLDADDTRVMKNALATLGVPLTERGNGEVEVGGARRFPVSDARIFCGNSGLSTRSLLAVLAFMNGTYELHGVPRLHERPIEDLAHALVEVGARIEYLGAPGHLPLRVLPWSQGEAARHLVVRGGASSQFLTGLLQAAPLLAEGGPVAIEVEGELISRPYVALTLATLAAFGVRVEGGAWDRPARFVVPAGARYHSPGAYRVEGDASSASYFLGLGALAEGPVRVEGVGPESAQADVAFAAVIEQMGAIVRSGPGWIEARAPARGRLHGIQANLNHMPDAAMTVAVLAALADSPSRLSDIGSWRVKETDRLAAVASELRKLGAGVTEGPDWIAIEPAAPLKAASIATYDDHRMAMSFALAAAGGVPVTIEDPGCVAKTVPDYFERLARLVDGAGGAFA